MSKCADCGYLSVRNKKNYGLDEVDIDFRTNGKVATAWDDIGRNPHTLHREIPLCLVMEQYLGDAFKVFNDPSSLFKQITSVIQKEIVCTEFTKWQQGFTPKEHREMIDRERERRENHRWRMIELIILGVMATLVAGGFTILGAFIAKGN